MRGWGAVAALAALLAGAPAFAGQLEISPTRLDLRPDARVTALKVLNSGRQPVTVQVRGFRWSQEGGNDRLADTTELIASPPIFELEPGRTQIVRVGLRSMPATAGEYSYRLLLDEIPSADRQAGQALSLPLRISLPVFARVGSPGEPNLSWELISTGRELQLAVRNDGASHEKLRNLRITDTGGDRSLGGLVYVLPGSERRFRIGPDQAGAAGGELRVSATTDEGGVDERLARPHGDVALLPDLDDGR